MNKKIIMSVIVCVLLVMSIGIGIGVSIEAINASKSEVSTSKLKNIFGGELNQGTYTVGKDLEEGVYIFEYTATADEDDYMSYDYITVTTAGSKGIMSIFAGTKHDSVGGWNYEKASEGVAKSHMILHKGDVIDVDTDYGEWSY
jgi:hypothetical protein